MTAKNPLRIQRLRSGAMVYIGTSYQLLGAGLLRREWLKHPNPAKRDTWKRIAIGLDAPRGRGYVESVTRAASGLLRVRVGRKPK